MKRLPLSLLLLVVGFVAPRPSQSQERGAAALGGLVAGLGTSARVLIVGAHPDDEDTRLIAWLARGRHVETAYLSLTRGDGGQNIIGNELGEALGVIRTEELLAARGIDGASQYFARAYDFGYSKSADEAFRHWPRDTLLGDVVRVVRAFKPHVVITIFSGTPEDGHGQHQVSGILGREAYDVAGDTVRFPTAQYGAAWTPAKFYRARSYRRHAGATYRYNPGEYNPLLGRSYAEIAAESRGQHRSQAQGSIAPRGPLVGSLKREATRVNESTPAEQERGIFDGIDTTYARLAGAVPAAQVRELTDAIAAARTKLNLITPDSMVAPLARVVRAVDAVAAGEGPRPGDAERSLAVLRQRSYRALALAAGVELTAVADRELLAKGEPVGVTTTLYNRGRRPVCVGQIGAATMVGYSHCRQVAPDSSFVLSDTVAVIPMTDTAQPPGPWWLVRPRRGDMFDVRASNVAEGDRTGPATGRAVVVIDDEMLRAQQTRTSLTGSYGTNFELSAPVVYRYADPVKGEVRHPLDVAPPISITLDRTAEYAPANVPIDRSLRVMLRSASATPRDIAVALELPNGLAADWAERRVTVPAFGVQTVDFRVRGRLAPGRHTIRARARSGDETYTRGYVQIEYEHIRPQRIHRDAAIDVHTVDVAVPRTLAVAYLPGASDNSAPALRQLGVNVTVLDPAAIATADFSRFTTVVLGPRFFEAHPGLRAGNGRLLDFARAGGTVVVQYGQEEMAEPGLMPYPVTYVRPADRVTDESAPVRVLDPTSRVLTTPNRITEADFAGWVQDRTLYMPRTFDEHYAAPLATHDPGEPPNSGAILVAPVGRGTYVYTTFAFFRQLPAGVPGAARLFVNLLSAGRGKREAGSVTRRANGAVEKSRH